MTGFFKGDTRSVDCSLHGKMLDLLSAGCRRLLPVDADLHGWIRSQA